MFSPFFQTSTIIPVTINDILSLQTYSNEHLLESHEKGTLRLHPKALVACMRIDSFFSPSLVPSFQGVLTISQIKLNIINHIASAEIPDIMKDYKIIEDYSKTQSFLSLSFKHFKIHSNMYVDIQTSVHGETEFSIDIIDYAYLSVQPLIEEFRIQSFVEINDDTINANLVVSDIKLRYGPSIAHSLAVSQQIWSQILTRESTKHVLFTRFIVCNNTIVPLQFGQSESEEKIFLRPKECSLYAFRSEKLLQNLSFGVQEDNVWIFSSPTAIAADGSICCNLDNEHVVVVNTQKISSSQKMIVVKGQLEFLNKTEHPFVVEYSADAKPVDFYLGAKTSCSVVTPCFSDQIATIR